MKRELLSLRLELRQTRQHIFQIVHIDVRATESSARVSRSVDGIVPAETGVLLGKLAKVRHQGIDSVLHV